MHWNGYAGCVMCVGGALGCDVAVPLHGAHRSLVLCMADGRCDPRPED